MSFLFLFFGFLFGYFLFQAGVHRYNTISGMATLEDFTVAKTIMLALGLGALLLSVEFAAGVADFHVKPFITFALITGGLIFGAGMAILGYCPGTLVISAGEGSLDALAGIAGAVAGGVIYYFAAPDLQFLFFHDLGKITLHTVTRGFDLICLFAVLIFSSAMITGAFYLHRFERGKDMKWAYAGSGLAVLNGIMIMSITVSQPLSASSFYPWAGASFLGWSDLPWFGKLSGPGSSQAWFLGGAMLAGLIFSLLRKEFNWRVIHARWQHYKGDSVFKRLVYAFAGGFLLLFGARLAGGCTSGHIISGGMQLAFSSLLFAVFTFAGLLLTGRFFYRKR